MPHDDLSNHFLIAMPSLEGSYFGGALIYVCRHGEDGTLGLVVNQPMNIPLSEIFEQFELEDERPYPARQTVLSGGPVETDKGFILHSGTRNWESTIPLDDNLRLTTSKDILGDIAANRGPDEYQIALGCTGWAPGQLEQEVMDNAWLVCPVNKDILFSDDHSEMARLVTANMGFDLNQLSPNTSYS